MIACALRPHTRPIDRQRRAHVDGVGEAEGRGEEEQVEAERQVQVRLQQVVAGPCAILQWKLIEEAL